MSKHLKLFILLLILYIGLGLPDSLLSTTWPDISKDINVSVGYISVFSIIAIFCSMISSSMTYKLNSLLGVVNVILLSMFMCFSGIIIFLVFRNFESLILVQVIMGLGAGAIDSNVNFIASQNLKVGEMNFLHGFWGVGVTLTPLITTAVYTLGFNEWAVYAVVAGLFVLLIGYAYMFRELLDVEISDVQSEGAKLRVKGKDMLGIAIYFLYGVEFLIGTFLASYLVTIIGVSSAKAAFAVSCYWGGLMVSRLLMPIIFKYVKSSKVLYLHISILTLCAFLINVDSYNLLILTFILIGYCFGPIFPTFVHYTERINGEQAGFYISRQISSMYLSIFLSQVLVGALATKYSLAFFSSIVMIMILLLVVFIFIYLNTYKSVID
ncbi:MFS transporter [Mollicutes bacterium LVI A0078]|nr:MFS transporter [Mollicutes bacterium LVI A0075]WOO91554.1 MFS transporter [Mollicutes bacterium LVI A0078]